ncbi:hypothetical protein CCY99_09130 [Helicobacter sp. 16-1353]|uniref:formyltransferase family protein n=1 Tax=Helicobacter sp. 16-1353 TaxID=2004996 RepID=UPI000DCD0DA5|nr:formyltransferase family protein [Helicobacter sp. 16-1353]RAX51431.1 hypothetical protein CCY99_09130 [Helicobacter sp. 16-1353]
MKTIFIGNRLNVLNAILESKLNLIAIFLQKDSYASKQFQTPINIPIIIFDNKDSLINEIKKYRFDLLVSNGCPYILPISKLKTHNQVFINIHPSLLPKLRGKNPINGAVLFNTNAGVSVHTMTDEIDRGEILAQIKIPIKNLPLSLLYKLCFNAEAKAFKMALDSNFIPLNPKPKYKESYYSRPKDIKTNININNKELIRKINAFSIPQQTSKIITKQGEIQVLKATTIKNPYLDSIAKDYMNYEIVEQYENKILIYKDNEFLELEIYPKEQIKHLHTRAILWGGGNR